MLCLIPAAVRLLRAVVNVADGAEFDRVRGGRLRLRGTDLLVNRSTLEELLDNGLVRRDGSDLPVFATAIGRRCTAGRTSEPVAPRPELSALILAGRSAVHAVEEYGSPDTVGGLFGALCNLPLTDMDDLAESILHETLRVVAFAEDAEEWELLGDVERTVSQFLHEPDGATMDHPALLALVVLTAACGNAYNMQVKDPVELRAWAASPERAAWSRAFLSGLAALRQLVDAIDGTGNGRALDAAMTELRTAVRHVISYQALYAARRALAEAARCYGLPEAPFEL